ncbi:MAG: tyrosine--tRNA ligase [Planctomycetota bacterium]|nr:tyrosine--tRNA ligase [Planctomycetota bacterium]
MTDSKNTGTQLDIILRGTVDVLTVEDLRAKLDACSKGKRPPLRVKLGMDPTAPDIHLGHSVVLRKCRQFQDLGHKVVLIIGDGMVSVGDPSGRSKTRPVLTREQISENCKSYFEQAGKILDLDEQKLEIVYNGDWFFNMDFSEVIKLASQMTVARLLERDDFAKRYKEGLPISLHEMFYPIMQGYDSVMVQADVEMGGTDQTFNLLVGRSLQPSFGQKPQVPVTMPLLVGLDGSRKMSKSLGNYVSVIDEPREMFGKLMSIPDELMRSYFTLCTDVSLDEVDRLLSGHPMEAKKQLAMEIVTLDYDDGTPPKPNGKDSNEPSPKARPPQTPRFSTRPNPERTAATGSSTWFGLRPLLRQTKRLAG